MTGVDPRARYAAIILLVALLASLAVAVFRERTETHTKSVELAMDYTDFLALARSFNYKPEAFLRALRVAGLTSLAVTEELGQNVGDNGNASAQTGAQIVNAARVTSLADPVLARMAKDGTLKPQAIYLLVNDKATYERYRRELALHFEPKTTRVLRDAKPWLLEVNTQIDYFNNTSLGIPVDQLELAKRLHFLVIPRFQNDERYAQAQIEADIATVTAIDPRISTIIFFGLRNQVMGYPDHLPDAAAVFKAHHYNFGTIETYDDSQIQKGNDTLARLIPGQTVRVQAIARTELDKLTLNEVIARYVLGVRERNIRVAYLRAWGHEDQGKSIEATNVAMVHEIATQLVDHGFKLGRAAPIPAYPSYKGDSKILVGIAVLAVPSIFVLLLAFFGWYRLTWAIAAYAVTVLLYGAGVALHHELFVRSAFALAGALLFATAAFLAIAGAFAEPPSERFGRQAMRSAGWTLVAIGVALFGALVVVGIMSSPLTMEEIERFRGVKFVLGLPPLIALALYLFSRRYDSGVERPGDVLFANVRAYHVFVGVLLAGAAALFIMRSGNQSDIAPSQFELSLRHGLSSLLSVRPRFKEFLIGAPAMMLVPALAPAHRRAVGWLLALCIGVAIGDVIDTFSHLHTPLLISFVRVILGVLVGAGIGLLLIWLYRRFVRPRAV